MEIKRYVNEEEILGELPELVIENVGVVTVLQGLVRDGEEKE